MAFLFDFLSAGTHSFGISAVVLSSLAGSGLVGGEVDSWTALRASCWFANPNLSTILLCDGSCPNTPSAFLLAFLSSIGSERRRLPLDSSSPIGPPFVAALISVSSIPSVALAFSLEGSWPNTYCSEADQNKRQRFHRQVSRTL